MSPLPSWLRHYLCRAFPLPSRLRHRRLPCVSTASAATTPPLPCITTASAAKTPAVPSSRRRARPGGGGLRRAVRPGARAGDTVGRALPGSAVLVNLLVTRFCLLCMMMALPFALCPPRSALRALPPPHAVFSGKVIYGSEAIGLRWPFRRGAKRGMGAPRGTDFLVAPLGAGGPSSPLPHLPGSNELVGARSVMNLMAPSSREEHQQKVGEGGGGANS